MNYWSSRRNSSNKLLIQIDNTFIVHLAARSYYVISTYFIYFISWHHAPHRTVLALFTHTAPQ